MRLSKVLLFVISLVLVVGIAQAKIDKNGALIIPKTTTAPVIDGKVDVIWNLVDETWMEYSCGNEKVADWSTCASWAKFVYDDHFIYGMYYVQDDYVDTTSTIDWQMDGIEFYCDVNNTHVSGSQLPAPAYQICLRPTQPIDSVQNAINKGLVYKWLLDTASVNNGGPSGYFLELKLSLDSLGFETPPTVGKTLSFQMQLDDNDGNGRVHILNWHYSALNADYQCTAGWGDAVLGDVFDTKFVFLKTSTAPVIDGKLDAIWKDANQLTMDYVQPQGAVYPAPRASVTEHDWRFYGLYDNNNIYGLFTVYDDYVDSTSTIDWQMDGIEFYSDVNNTHVSGSQLPAPAYQICLRPTQPIDSVNAAIKKGLDYKWTLVNQVDGSSITNDSVFSSRSGWQLEFKLNLDSLGYTAPPAIGSAFSFQLQGDDNDGNGRVHTSNWWYSALNADYQCTAGWGDAKFGPAIITGVDSKSPSVVTGYELAQNYPNPFNPSTEISFTLAKSGKVKLAVYDLLGKEIAVLVNGMRNAGSQTATFNAKNFSSGVYFYKLEAGNTVLAKKMILLK